MPAKIDQLSEYGITTKGHIIYKSQYKKVVNQATLLLNNLLIAKKSRKADQNKWPKGITRWDCIFLFAEEFLNNAEVKQWQNIENIIFNVVSFALLPNDGSKSFQSNLHFKESCDGEIDK